jgi:esterase/lipase superfamily enzyme
VGHAVEEEIDRVRRDQSGERERRRTNGGGRPTFYKLDYATIKVFFATDRNRRNTSDPTKMFGFDRGSITYGTCDVSIPRDHRMGVLESPSFLKLEFREDPEKHVLLLRISIDNRQKYFTDIASRIKESKKKNALIFVHGYNVTFEDAARRTGQMAYDLGFDGAPVFYSWPSQGRITGYLVDETNVEWSQNNLKHFLDDFASQTDAQNIFLIAHSMGTRALTRAFGQLMKEQPILRTRFREIILSAPDIDAEVFKRDIASQIVPATLYASSQDQALNLSKTFHGYPRAGDAGRGLMIVSGIETVDATKVATDFVGHSYFAESRSIIADIFYLIRDGKRAAERCCLQEIDAPTGRYWVFRP